MLHGVPLRATRRIVAHGHRQSEGIAELLLKVEFPGPNTAAVTATAIRQDEQLGCFWIDLLYFFLPPARNGINRELRSAVRNLHVDGAFVTGEVVNSKGHGAALGRDRKVVFVDFFGVPAPGASR